MNTPIQIFGVTSDPSSKMVLAVYLSYGVVTEAGMQVSGGAYGAAQTVPTASSVFYIGMVEAMAGIGSYNCIGVADLPNSATNYPYTAEVRQVSSGATITTHAGCLAAFAASTDIRAERQIPDEFLGGVLRNGAWGGVVYLVGGSGDAVEDGNDVGAAAYTSTGGTVINREVAQRSTTTLRYTVLNSAGTAIDVSARDLRFVISDLDGTVLFMLTSGDDEVTVTGDDGNEVAVEVSTEVTESPLAARYVLWDYTERDPIAVGAFTVKLAAL